MSAIEYSEDQKAAREAIDARLAAAGVDLEARAITSGAKDGEADVLAVLGKAGSGKTALLVDVAEALTEAGVQPIGGDFEPRSMRGKRSFAVLAPTNKAASVLRARGVPATTLHRILYIPVYDPWKGPNYNGLRRCQVVVVRPTEIVAEPPPNFLA